MNHVLLTSDLPWQHNDAITFFTCLCISRGIRSFIQKSLKGKKTVNKHAMDIIIKLYKYIHFTLNRYYST